MGIAKEHMHVTKGKNATDEATKVAADSKRAAIAPVVTVQPQATLNNIAVMQERAPPNEKNLWEEHGAMTYAHGLWRSHDGLMVISVTLVSVLVTCAWSEPLRKGGGVETNKMSGVLVPIPTGSCRPLSGRMRGMHPI